MSRDLTAGEKLKAILHDCEMRPLPGLARTMLNRIAPDPFSREGALPDGRKVIFIHVPKTGGTSHASALGLRYGHIPVTRYVTRDEGRFRSAYSFAFKRNPWRRLYSAFNYLRAAVGINNSPDVRWAEANLAQYSSFEEFVHALEQPENAKPIMRYKHFRSQSDWIAQPGSNRIEVDFLGRFENLAEETHTLSQRLGIEIELPHLRKPQAYREEMRFTPRMTDIIARLYRRDIEILGYRAPDDAGIETVARDR